MKIINSTIQQYFFSLLKSLSFLSPARLKILALFFKAMNMLFKGKEESIYLFVKSYKKLFWFSLYAVSITLSLFYLMTLLIDQNNNASAKKRDNAFIQFLSSKEVEDLKTKDRKLPEKPKKTDATPTVPRLKSQQKQLDKPQMQLPKAKLDISKDFKMNDMSGMQVGGAGQGDSDVSPIVRIEPRYPRNAAMTGTEGFVILQFDINATGAVTNISVLKASPPQIFNRNAVQALRKWKYKPRLRSGKPVKQTGLKVRLDFKLIK